MPSKKTVSAKTTKKSATAKPSKKVATANLHAKIVARAWRDDEFREGLLKRPHATLKAAGMEVPKGKKVRFHESSESEVHIVLPAKPSTGVKARRPAATANLTCIA